MYQSDLEPWSSYLTGVQGKAPDPYYDPLAFWVEEAHNRGLELHAWFNPYRAHLPRAGDVTETSIVKKKPHLARMLDTNSYWLDPGHIETQDHSVAVVLDVVKRYDVDGIHFDDYFYPYGDGNFPDSATWNAYLESGGDMSRNDWRRSNVNTFIERVNEGSKALKPWVKFGISPFGIWRPDTRRPFLDSTNTTDSTPTPSSGSTKAGWTISPRSSIGRSTRRRRAFPSSSAGGPVRIRCNATSGPA